MHAGDTNYTVIRKGVVVISGTGPAIRVADNRLVIRDGPKEFRSLSPGCRNRRIVLDPHSPDEVAFLSALAVILG